MMMVTEKTCSSCHKNKPAFEFNKNKWSKDGLQSWCTDCRKRKYVQSRERKGLKVHLESLFTGGINWENYGEWHIDHIRPLSKFNFTKPTHIDFKRAWSLRNLQPLWADDNRRKSDKVIQPFQISFAFECHD